MAPLLVRTISRYLLRQHGAPLGFALAALTSLMLIQQIAKQLSSLLGKGLPTGVIIEVFVLSVPFIVAVTLPMAVLVAVLHVFTRLAADNEITAMQAGGVSVGRLITPVLGGAAGVALLSFLWNDQLLPRTNHQLRILQVDIQRKKPSLALKEQVINEVVSGQFFLRAARIDGSSNRLKDVTIYDLADAERRRIISADHGRMAYTSGGRDLYLLLEDGAIEEVSRTDPTQFTRTFFNTNRLRVAGVANSFETTGTDTYKGDRGGGPARCSAGGRRRAPRDRERSAPAGGPRGARAGGDARRGGHRSCGPVLPGAAAARRVARAARGSGAGPADPAKPTGSPDTQARPRFPPGAARAAHPTDGAPLPPPQGGRALGRGGGARGRAVPGPAALDHAERRGGGGAAPAQRAGARGHL